MTLKRRLYVEKRNTGILLFGDVLFNSGNIRQGVGVLHCPCLPVVASAGRGTFSYSQKSTVLACVEDT